MSEELTDTGLNGVHYVSIEILIIDGSVPKRNLARESAWKVLEKTINDLISESQFQKIFFETIKDQAAILPVSHCGIQLL